MATDSQQPVSLSQADQSTAEVDPCAVCKKSISAKQQPLLCKSCNVSCHVSCVVSKFVSINGTAMRNSMQWMVDFLHSGNFQFVCQECVVTATSSGIPTPADNADITRCNKEIASVKLSIAALD
jgi:hypothetical protein